MIKNSNQTKLNYNLNQLDFQITTGQRLSSIRELLGSDLPKMGISIFAVMLNASATIITPFLISLAVDKYISVKDLSGLNQILGILVVLYLVTAVVSYIQTRLVGQISQRVLFRLRQQLFSHVQDLPMAFFQENRAGDIIARVNSDTDKVNNFLSGGVFQFVSSFFVFTGIGIFIFTLNPSLSLVVWFGVILVLIITQLISKMVRTKNKVSLDGNGEITAFLDENFNNFKALVAFNKAEYLKENFKILNQNYFQKAVWAQSLNGIFNPLYSFAGNLSQILVLGFGLYFITNGSLTVGLLIGFIGYTQKFYEPLKTLGNVWGSFQEAIAAWKRIETLLKVK